MRRTNLVAVVSAVALLLFVFTAHLAVGQSDDSEEQFARASSDFERFTLVSVGATSGFVVKVLATILARWTLPPI